jgi:hypothetical protein
LARLWRFASLNLSTSPTSGRKIMLTIKIKLLRIVISAVFVVASSYGVSAQSTVFNIPSTEVQPPKHFLVELNFTAHLSPFATGGYQSYGPNIIYGVNRRMEVGLNAVYTRTSPAEPSEIQPNFKLKLYENEGNGLAVATGAVAFVPVTHRTGSTTRGMVYAVGSKSFKGDRAPQITAGYYALVGSFAAGTSKQGVLLGLEQPLTRRFSFIADWSSGNNDNGYVAAGAGIVLTRKSAIYVGYNIGNQGRGNNALGVYYEYSF